LPLFRVDSPAYDALLDVFAECRRASGEKVTRAAPAGALRGEHAVATSAPRPLRY
jgi:hypothetical protein